MPGSTVSAASEGFCTWNINSITSSPKLIKGAERNLRNIVFHSASQRHEALQVVITRLFQLIHKHIRDSTEQWLNYFTLVWGCTPPPLHPTSQLLQYCHGFALNFKRVATIENCFWINSTAPPHGQRMPCTDEPSELLNNSTHKKNIHTKTYILCSCFFSTFSKFPQQIATHPFPSLAPCLF